MKKNTLEDIRYVLDMIGYHDGDMKIIHVAGTNGKGSVCAYMTSILVKAGYRVGTFVSPHLVDMRERIMLDGRPISEDDYTAAYDELLYIGDRLESEGMGRPTFFEYLFYVAMHYYINLNPKLDYLILETGLGGRLDATTSVEPILSVITSIGMDHMQYLGDTIEKIAYEKACIIAHHKPVVYDARDEISASVIRDIARKREAAEYTVTDEDTERLHDILTDIPVRYQRFDAVLAMRAIEVMGVTDMSKEDMVSCIRDTKWPARMQEVYADVYIDGAHNPAAAVEFCEAARSICDKRHKRPVLIVAAMADKDFDSVAQVLSERLSIPRIYACSLREDRAMNGEQLVSIISRHMPDTVAVSCASAKEALDRCMKEKEDEDIVFCMGSLYLAGEVLGIMKGRAYD